MFSSLNDNWRTPQTLYKKLDDEFHFNFDPCPSNPENNGLFIPWKERNFINPPYSEVLLWVEKAYRESLQEKLCVLLVAARTDTKWFHLLVLPYAKEIRFIRGRIHFENSNGVSNPAPFPSMIVIFDGRKKKSHESLARTNKNYSEANQYV
jgi:phage N-6-adenine-methyltransferase